MPRTCDPLFPDDIASDKNRDNRYIRPNSSVSSIQDDTMNV